MHPRTTLLVLGVLILAGLVSFALFSEKPEPPEAREVRWLISHQPTDVFVRAATVFAEELEKESEGALTLKILTPQDVGVASGDIPNARVFEILGSGEAELATTYTVALGKDVPAAWSLTLPFLFETYPEAGRVLDGEAGAFVREAVSSSTAARALAFTMSGGFRIIASKDAAIETLADLKGKRVATSGGPVAQATLESFGAVPVPTDLEGAGAWDPASIDAVETTYSRLSAVLEKNTQFTKFVNETNHSIFLTVVLASDAFYDSLSPREQTALEAAALKAAALEREDSAALGDAVRSTLIQKGTIVTSASPALKGSMREAAQPVYEQFGEQLGVSLIEALRAR